ncbi:hypothetical protein PIB30_020337 [Stylosanthes scabra]|uniref:Uncharacterized protein n=1 Tax=Stylosanthes scabra TaxID=79078 RepID=A0ABU6Y6W1_9FABA|nr:hypothetical protein [Stylosanthes scabra]
MASSGTGVEHVEIQRGRDAIPSQWGSKKVRSSSEPKGEIDALKENMLQIEEKLENTLKLFKEAQVRFEEARYQPTIIRETTKIDFPRPKEFKGVRDAREVENILWQMESFFEGQGVVEESTKHCQKGKELQCVPLLSLRPPLDLRSNSPFAIESSPLLERPLRP